MKIEVVDRDKDDQSNSAKLVLSIYEEDYRFTERGINKQRLNIENRSCSLSFDFANSILCVSVKKDASSFNDIIRIHIKCNMLGFSRTVTCPVNWSDWYNMGIAPMDSAMDSDSDGAIHSLNIYLNFCQLRDKTFISLSEDKDFLDVFLISDGKNAEHVAMHKPVLSAHSSTFRSMLLGEWKNARIVSMKVEANLQTLRQLRNYLYVGLLPETSILPLMSIAQKYNFENLMTDAVFSVLNLVDSNNLLQFRNFALENNLTDLIEALHEPTMDEMEKTALKLEMLKVSQVKAKNRLKKKDSCTSLSTQATTSTFQGTSRSLSSLNLLRQSSSLVPQISERQQRSERRRSSAERPRSSERRQNSEKPRTSEKPRSSEKPRTSEKPQSTERPRSPERPRRQRISKEHGIFSKKKK